MRIAMVNKSWQDMGQDAGCDAAAASCPGALPQARGGRESASAVGSVAGDGIAANSGEGALRGDLDLPADPRRGDLPQARNAARRRICALGKDRPLALEEQLVLYYSYVAPENAAKACERGDKKSL